MGVFHAISHTLLISSFTLHPYFSNSSAQMATRSRHVGVCCSKLWLLSSDTYLTPGAIMLGAGFLGSRVEVDLAQESGNRARG
jgi:hypothetical protein